MTAKKILLARIGAASGIKGEVRLKPFGDPNMLDQYGRLETADGTKFRITSMRPQGRMMIVKFEGINDRNAAEALNGADLYVDRAKLPEPDEDEFYVSDLIGMKAIDANGDAFGVVRDVPNFGAGDMLEIDPADGGSSYYIPFSREVVPTIDFDNKTLTIIPPSEVSERDREE